MRTIAVLNYKGGVGKTTFTISVSQALAMAGFRVLAIDNDSQHHLSLVVDGNGQRTPSIREVYRSSVGIAGKKLLDAITETGLRNFHIIPSHAELTGHDVKDTHILEKAIEYASLSRFYDYIMIDNSPGIDILQETAMHAADEIFVPTELSYFAVNGIIELHRILDKRFRGCCPITKIVPNGYKGTNKQIDYLEALMSLYSEKITETFIPYDPVFDTCMKEQKTLFIHKLFSKAAAHYLKLIHELFDLDEKRVWEQVCDVKQNHLRGEARQRFFEQQKRALMDEPEENKKLQQHLQTQVVFEDLPAIGKIEF
ncbi:MAG: ParA family protein [Chitinispirillia bacterium]|nr:ParA family protein [Chitinispirillia bacterium]MCL2267679.1 ParA family protein [Chitinispirillia bacterium]